MSYVTSVTQDTQGSRLAFFDVGGVTVSAGVAVPWVKQSGDADITMDTGEVTLPAGYIWTLATQIGLNQAAARSFKLYVNGVESTSAVGISAGLSDTANQLVHNVLDSRLAPLTVSWRNAAGSAYTLTAGLNALVILGVSA